jgi:hypothetical protein
LPMTPTTPPTQLNTLNGSLRAITRGSGNYTNMRRNRPRSLGVSRCPKRCWVKTTRDAPVFNAMLSNRA